MRGPPAAPRRCRGKGLAQQLTVGSSQAGAGRGRVRERLGGESAKAGGRGGRAAAGHCGRLQGRSRRRSCAAAPWGHSATIFLICGSNPMSSIRSASSCPGTGGRRPQPCAPQKYPRGAQPALPPGRRGASLRQESNCACVCRKGQAVPAPARGTAPCMLRRAVCAHWSAPKSRSAARAWRPQYRHRPVETSQRVRRRRTTGMAHIKTEEGKGLTAEVRWQLDAMV